MPFCIIVLVVSVVVVVSVMVVVVGGLGLVAGSIAVSGWCCHSSLPLLSL